MKKITLVLFSLVIGAFAFQSCEDQDDNAVPVSDFIWKGLNAYYLWQADVPNLADDRFSNQEQLNKFLEAYSSPEELFESLRYQPGVIDRFSVIFPDFTVLENLLAGVTKNNGMDYRLSYINREDAGSTTAPIIGYVRYVMPGSDALNKGIRRGDIFTAVNGIPLTAANYTELLGADTYTLTLATIENEVITSDGREVALVKTEFAENPVNTVTTTTVGNHIIGYVMYTGFYGNYDTELNAAFGQLQSAGVTDIVLDLRYNGGGSVRTATYLGSMIAGEGHVGDLFAKQQWNAKLQAKYERENPAALQNLFSATLSDNAPINMLHNITKVYVLTSEETASASELVINCLKPYVDVYQIGTKTVGKNVGSVTLYDSKDFSARGRSGSHRYAMQPIVIRTINAEGFGEYSDGITPDLILEERVSTLGTLGDPSEPYFAAAIAQITANGRFSAHDNNDKFIPLERKDVRRFKNEMYIETTPDGSGSLVKDLQ